MKAKRFTLKSELTFRLKRDGTPVFTGGSHHIDADGIDHVNMTDYPDTTTLLKAYLHE